MVLKVKKKEASFIMLADGENNRGVFSCSTASDHWDKLAARLTVSSSLNTSVDSFQGRHIINSHFSQNTYQIQMCMCYICVYALSAVSVPM